MKWGVRSSRNKVKTSSDFKKSANLRKKKPQELSNKQLQTINKRIEMEKKFKQLNPTTLAKGHATAKEILAISGTIGGLVAIANTPHGRAAIKLGTKFVKDAAFNRRVRNTGKWTWVNKAPLAIEAASRVVG